MKTSDARKLYLADIEAKLAPVPGENIRGYGAMQSMVRAIPRYPVCEFNEPDEDVLIFSDLHLGHENIIRYTNRPFRDVDDMNAALWDHLAAGLEPDKVLVVVGDMAMREALNAVTWQQIRDLDCRQRHLVLGNHDLTGAGELRAQGFDSVWSLMLSGGEPPLIWTHYPLNEVPDGYVNIHGHVHDNPLSIPVENSPKVPVENFPLSYKSIENYSLSAADRCRSTRWCWR